MLDDDELLTRPWFSLSRADQARQDAVIKTRAQKNAVAYAAADAKLRTMLEMAEQDSGTIEAARQVAWLDHDRSRVSRSEKGDLAFPSDWPKGIDPAGYVRQQFTQKYWDGAGTAAPDTGNKWVKGWREKLKNTI